MTNQTASVETLESFFAAIADEPNLFAANRINDPLQFEFACDVAEIHQEVFHALTTVIEDAAAGAPSAGVALTGGAGYGKSHLLARLARWANKDRQAIYLYLHNLLVEPSEMPAYLWKCVVSQLTSGAASRWHDSSLYWIVADAIRAVARQANVPIIRENNHEMARELLAAELIPNPSVVFDVLFEFFCASTRAELYANADGDARSSYLAKSRIAVRWLMGDALDVEDARQIHLRSTHADDYVAGLGRIEEVEDAICVLCRLAQVVGRPVILCFDQVDNMGEERVRELARFLHALLDKAPNMVVVFCGVKETMEQFRDRQVIGEAAADRLFQHELAIHRIFPEQACKLVESRLEKITTRFAEVEEVRQRLQADSLFPLSQHWLNESTRGMPDLRPRDILSMARRDFDIIRRQVSRGLGVEWLRHWPNGQSIHPKSAIPADSQTTHESVDARVNLKLSDLIEQNLSSTKLPVDAAKLSELTLVLLDYAQKGAAEASPSDRARPSPSARGQGEGFFHSVHAVSPVSSGPRPACSLVLSFRQTGRRGHRKMGVAFMRTDAKASAAATLRTLVQEADKVAKVILVTPEGGFPELGEKGRSHYKSLERMGPEKFEHLILAAKDIAEMEALVQLVGLAKAGDLEFDDSSGQSASIPSTAVLDSYHRSRRLLRHPLISRLLDPVGIVPTPAELEHLPF